MRYVVITRGFGRTSSCSLLSPEHLTSLRDFFFLREPSSSAGSLGHVTEPFLPLSRTGGGLSGRGDGAGSRAGRGGAARCRGQLGACVRARLCTRHVCAHVCVCAHGRTPARVHCACMHVRMCVHAHVSACCVHVCYMCVCMHVCARVRACGRGGRQRAGGDALRRGLTGRSGTCRLVWDLLGATPGTQPRPALGVARAAKCFRARRPEVASVSSLLRGKLL